MTKKDLIKRILELGKELEKANGFDAIMIINDMEIEVDNYTKELPIQLVCNCQGCGEEKKIEYCEKCYAENLPDISNNKTKQYKQN